MYIEGGHWCPARPSTAEQHPQSGAAPTAVRGGRFREKQEHSDMYFNYLCNL